MPFEDAKVALVFPVGPGEAVLFHDRHDVPIVSQPIGPRHCGQAAELTAIQLEAELARAPDRRLQFLGDPLLSPVVTGGPDKVSQLTLVLLS
jgi:hypothetical protein